MDCLILGFYDTDFPGYVEMVRSMGEDSGAYRDLNLAFIDFQGKPYRSMDILNHFYFEEKGAPARQFNNADFLWPVITYLGTYLAKRGFSFDYVNLPHLEKDKLKDLLSQNDILTIAITTTLYVSVHPILELISLIREHNSTAKIIVGGPFISNQPKLGDFQAIQRLFQYIGADIYVVSQEGETALVNILSALKNKTSLDQVDNIAYRQGERYVATATSIESNQLEENMVDYALFSAREVGEFVTLRTAKSCPFSCAFCGFPQRAGKYKYLSVELVEQELNAIREMASVTTLTFIDDTFNVPKDRFREILRMMIKNNYGFKWNSFYRSDHGDERTIELMGKAGCEGVFLGVESGSDEMLSRMNKTARRRDYLNAIPLLKEAGISTHANVIVGFPGETYESFQETIDLIETARPDFYRAQLWYADPITPIWNKRDDYGVKGSSFNWSHDTMDYQYACDLVEKMFLAIEGSVWLPQNGFEQWSTFYLQRKGMSMDRIKTFLALFNSLIKRKLIGGNGTGPGPQLFEALKTSCRFDQPAAPNINAIDVLSGSQYLAAENFWTGEAAGAITEEGLLKPKSGSTPSAEGVNYFRRSVDGGILKDIQVRCRIDPCCLLLTAYSVLLSRLDGREEITVVSAISKPGVKGVIPIFLQASWNITFRALAGEIERKIIEGMRYQDYAFHLLTNPYRMTERNCAIPRFKFGFVYSEGERTNGAAEPGFGPDFSPQIRDGFGLILSVNNGEAMSLKLWAAKNWFDPDAADRLGQYMTSILEQIAQDQEIHLREILTVDWGHSVSLALKQDAGEEFNL